MSVDPAAATVDLVEAIRSLPVDRAEAAGATDEGATEVENALWRVDAAFEKLHDVIALGLGVPALKLDTNRRGIRTLLVSQVCREKQSSSMIFPHEPRSLNPPW